LFLQNFGQYGRRMARDGKAIGPRGQGRLENTTSGSVKAEVVFFDVACVFTAKLIQTWIP